MFGVLDFFFEQVDFATGVSQNCDDVFNVSSEAYSFDDVDRYCEGGEQRFGLASVSCTCGGEGRGCCGKIRSGVALCSSGRELETVLGAKWRRFVTHLKRKEIKRRTERTVVSR